MYQPLNHTGAVCSLLLGVSILTSGIASNNNTEISPNDIGYSSAKIQAAILLDVSNSMDGLIEQAKSQLWNMVSVMGKVKCSDGLPKIEIALYEYGRVENDSKEGFVRQISGFTNDLDKISRELYSLTTHGGDEYCGHVINNSLNHLNWDTSSGSYKVIFIAGNEDFLQGDIHYAKACAVAMKKGVIVNTIYCGNKEQGIREHWNLGAECGNGSFMNIDQDAKPVIILTPYDDELITLNTKLTDTYIYYGEDGISGYNALRGADTSPVYSLTDMSKIVAYSVTRSDKRFYDDSAWELIAASEKDISILDKVDMKTLPDSLRGETREKLKQIVEAKTAERKSIKNQIADVSKRRDNFIAEEKAKTQANNPQTLESAIQKIIEKQVTRHKMTIE